MKRWCMILLLLLTAATVLAQPDKRDVRKGNRQFRKENWPAADIHYRKALLADSTSVAGNYNLANTLYREGDFGQAGTSLGKIAQSAPATPHAADYFYNVGDVALQNKDYKAAVEAFAASLLIRPDDMDAKENYIYAKMKLQDQQQNGGGQDQNQNQDQKQDQDQKNQDQNNNQDQQNQDQNQDQNQEQNQEQNHGQGRQEISPQQAQQLLQAIQAEEKETQDKVKKEKAAVLKSKQKEKNW